MSTVGNAIAKFVLKVFWPWFLKHIWPLIVKHIIELIARGLKGLAERIVHAVSASSERRAAAATTKAREADEKAKSAATAAEREKQEAISQVWREVAEQLRAENESLKQQISEALASQQLLAEREVESLQPRLEGTGSRPALVIQGERTVLPVLPNAAREP